MPIMYPKSSYNKGKFVNAPKDTKDARGKPGMGATSRQSMKKNMIKVEKPNSGDNSSFKKIGSKIDV